jgi:Enoyl-(Acyl carrier protein) reductase
VVRLVRCVVESRTRFDILVCSHGLVLNPVRRVGEPADVGRAALWLADAENGCVTGTVVVLDGGQTSMLSTPWAEVPEVLASSQTAYTRNAIPRITGGEPITHSLKRRQSSLSRRRPATDIGLRSDRVRRLA